MSKAARILLVDDEVSIQRALAPLLRSRGYEVEVVATGAEALRTVSTHAPDLMVLDLGLPEQHVPAALLCFNLGVELGQV